MPVLVQCYERLLVLKLLPTAATIYKEGNKMKGEQLLFFIKNKDEMNVGHFCFAESGMT